MEEKNYLFMDLQFFGGNDDEEIVEDEVVDEVEEDETTDDDGEDTFTDTEVKDETKPESKKQSKETNAYYKQLRLEEKAKKDAIEKARFEGTKETLIKSYNGVNPFTGEKIEDDLDVQELLDMIELKNNGSEEPEVDYRKFKKQKERELLKQKEQEISQKEFIEKDALEFQNKFGKDYDLNKVVQDEDFIAYCGEQLGKEPISNLFTRYLNYQNYKKGKSADEKLMDKAVKQSTVGSMKGSNSSSSDKEYYTMEEINNMTDAQIRKNLEKINKSIDYWRTK